MKTREERSYINRGNSKARKIFPNLGKCECCNREAKERHHINGDTHDNSCENIQFLCKQCHHDAHSIIRKRVVPLREYLSSPKLHEFAKKARKSIKMTQRAVAAAMGVTPPYLWDLEKGNRSWTDDLITRWEKATGLKFPTTAQKEAHAQA